MVKKLIKNLTGGAIVAIGLAMAAIAITYGFVMASQLWRIALS